MGTNTDIVFHVLDVVDSSNNYAMRAVHEGLADHGFSYFARAQTGGKGQRGKSWHSQPSENLLMSTVIRPSKEYRHQPFLFNAKVALVCRQFLEDIISEPVNIKWPNDLYCRDRKAGGILIENNYRGKDWNWAVIGVGINVNQSGFPNEAGRPISIRQITGAENDAEALARQLQIRLLESFTENEIPNPEEIMNDYNRFLFRRNEKVILKHEENELAAEIIGVEPDGRLCVTVEGSEKHFSFGEVQWIL